MFRRTLIIGILLLIITACKSGNPPSFSGKCTSTKGDDQITTSSSGTAIQVGSGKLEIVLTYTSNLGDGEATIMDNGITPFILKIDQTLTGCNLLTNP